MGQPEMTKGDQVRNMGAAICRFANGTSCLCIEKDRPLCKNVKDVALACWETAHQTEMTRAEFNKANRFTAAVDKPNSTAPKPVRRARIHRTR